MDEAAEPVTSLPLPVLGAKRAFYSLVAFFVPQVVAGLLVGVASGRGSQPATQAHSASAHLPGLSATALMAASFVGMIFGGLLVLADARRALPGTLKSGALSSMGWAPASPRALRLAVLAGLTLVSLYAGSMIVFPPGVDQKFGVIAGMLGRGGWGLHIWAIGAILVAPPVEEFVFRGVALAGFSRTWGIGVAATLVTIIFIGLHLSESAHYLPATVFLALCSVALLIARLRSKSLLPAIVLHATYNLGLVLMLYAGRLLPG